MRSFHCVTLVVLLPLLPRPAIAPLRSLLSFLTEVVHVAVLLLREWIRLLALLSLRSFSSHVSLLGVHFFLFYPALLGLRRLRSG